MALDLRDIKHVDDETLKLMSGYLRNICKTMNQLQMETPELILTICTLFYFQLEFF